MSPDDIINLITGLNEFLGESLGIELTDLQYDALSDFMHMELDSFIRKDRNYN